MMIEKNFSQSNVAFKYLRFNLCAIFGLSLAAFYQLWNLAISHDYFVISFKWRFTAWVSILCLIVNALLIILSFSKKSNSLNSILQFFITRISRQGKLNFIYFLLLACVDVTLLIFLGKYLTDFFSQFVFIYIFAFLSSFFIQAIRRQRRSLYFWVSSFIFSMLLIVFIDYIAVLFSSVTNYPFSLDWSETSRYYYASLPFSKSLYGISIPLSPLHPSRYLLQSIPFLFNIRNLWVHRIWQDLLWFLLPLLFGLSIVRRVDLNNTFQKILLIVWVFLFLQQGPVYYHLILCPIIVISGYSGQKFGKTLLFVMFSSIWAGISRVNWIPVPGLLAATIFLLETPYTNNFFQYVKKPLMYFLTGITIGFISQVAYIPLSGNLNIQMFTTSFTSDLLWYRLLPNSSFPAGILPGILIITLPIGIYMVKNIFNRNLHTIRKLGILAILMALFLGGLVVSVKIGGGSNLHNFDAFLITVVIIAIFIYTDRFNFDLNTKLKSKWQPGFILALILILPLLWGIPVNFSIIRYDSEGAKEVVDQIKNTIATNAPKGKVLFINQRQLVTFSMINNISLIPDFEQTLLMEMSMAKNQPYLSKFYQDLKDHRFELIITFPQDTALRDDNYSLPEESNAWNMRIARPLLNYYQPLISFPDFGIEILHPKN